MLSSVARVTAAYFRVERLKRASHLVSIASSLLYPAARVAVLTFLLKAVFESPAARSLPVDFRSAGIYVLTGVLLTVTLGFNNGAAIADRVRSGQVVFDLLRPHSWMVINVGERLGPRLANLIAPVLAYSLAVWLAGYTQPARFYGILVMMLPTVWLLEFLISFIIAVLTLSTQNSWGLGVAVSWPQQLLSGAMVPLILVPDRLRTMAYLTPFPGLLDLPIRAALGLASPLTALGVQLSWITLLGLCSILLYRRVITRIRINGG
ncbi:MAG: ABC-2 family transporter protein [Bacillota bacterium]|nr:ABC-2 family transporter protein [Bacillota bacterium]